MNGIYLRIIRNIYNTLFIVLLPLLFIKLMVKSLRLKAGLSRWKELLGIMIKLFVLLVLQLLQNIIR